MTNPKEDLRYLNTITFLLLNKKEAIYNHQNLYTVTSGKSTHIVSIPKELTKQELANIPTLWAVF